ncbi:MAG: hypothetical protein A2W91_16845 [Bacteroidetes bacterium GWF2_38_335]|nr:MAG: hypothetical protein A2W91_16845 [Bacteroidetes bacterium GWF2_38_335]OFY81352.1 MAG: hypothetical protein A2281_07820 [Bacteroidetes bacterium RIFOXYA12_FULL_38_20]HBS85475.1 toll/interleukin-1 receptor domain-containing protein [Bacteroidales bacterium]
MRDTLFISHATPEDNEFTIWIASRLELLGYKVWIDKEGLLGGERFWKEIDGVIRNHAAKILLVYSNNICYDNQPGELKTGINKEIELAESISSHEKIKDFIIPLHIDNAPYDLFVGSNMLNHILFKSDWALGMEQLLKKLEKDCIPKVLESTDSTIAKWFESEYLKNNEIINRKELYYSSWWSVDNLPESFFMYVFENKKQADAVHFANDIPIGKISNVLTTFEESIDLIVERDGEIINITPKEKHQITATDLLFGFESDNFPTHKDAENHFKKLFNQFFHQLMRKKKLFWCELANKKFAYYYVPSTLKNPRITFNYPYSSEKRKKKTKILFGKYKSLGKWHYAISAKPSLSPFIGFDIKSHIFFTTDGFQTWADKDKIHSHRRAKGRRFFNEEWRDMQLAFIQGLKDYNGKIGLVISKKKEMFLKEWPEMFWANFGYNEPTNKKPEDMLKEYFFDDDDDEGGE